jgi:hypothetical protein
MGHRMSTGTSEDIRDTRLDNQQSAEAKHPIQTKDGINSDITEASIPIYHPLHHQRSHRNNKTPAELQP